jgi:hypothetical protein
MTKLEHFRKISSGYVHQERILQHFEKFYGTSDGSPAAGVHGHCDPWENAVAEYVKYLENLKDEEGHHLDMLDWHEHSPNDLDAKGIMAGLASVDKLDLLDYIPGRVRGKPDCFNEQSSFSLKDQCKSLN